MAKINWKKAQREYVSNPTISMDDIAKKYGVSDTAVRDWASRYKWTELRKQALQKIGERLPEKLAESAVEYQTRRFKEGKMVADKALEVLTDPTTKIGSKVATEMFIAGHKEQAASLGLDKPNTQVNIQNNLIGWDEFMKRMEERKK